MFTNEQRPAAQMNAFAGWMALLTRLAASVTAVLMAYYFLFASDLSPWLTWSLIGSQVVTLIAFALWQLTFRG